MKLRLIFTLILLTSALMAVIPGSAQETARVRFVNLRVASTGVEMADSNGTPLASLGPFGSISDAIEVDASVTGLSYSQRFGSTVSTGGSFGTSPRFTAGHEHLVVVIGDDEEDDVIIYDITSEFGGLDSVADDGLGRLYLIYFVRELTGGAFTLWNADGTPLGSYFLALDFDDLDVDAQTVAVGLLPGEYTLSATAANDPTSNLLPEQSLTLAADELTMVALVGANPDTVQALVLSPDGVTVIGAGVP